MATITSERKILTLINVFTTKPQNQQRLVDILVAMPHLRAIRELAEEMNLGRYEVVYSEEAV